jgi:glycosyltransferase involved in cell wall biosynthesis
LKNITGIITTLNEEDNIEKVVRSLQNVCDEIIVVDSESSDKSVEIAKSLGCIVITQKYLGDGAQKDFGVDFAKNRWILNIDADERLAQDMIEDIESIDLSKTLYDSFSFRRKSFIGDRFQKLWYPDNIVRLYDKEKCRYSHEIGHAKVEAKSTKKLNSHILHYSYKNYSEMAKKIDKFSSRGAKMLYAKGKISKPWTPILRGFFAFFKKLILKGGIFMGVDGWTISIFSGFNTYLKYAMLHEMQNFHKEKS